MFGQPYSVALCPHKSSGLLKQTKCLGLEGCRARDSHSDVPTFPAVRYSHDWQRFFLQSSMASLPPSAGIQPVDVYALSTGELNHPDRWLFEDGDGDIMGARYPYPDFSFLIRHHSGQNILFDLGLAKVVTILTCRFQHTLADERYCRTSIWCPKRSAASSM